MNFNNIASPFADHYMDTSGSPSSSLSSPFESPGGSPTAGCFKPYMQQSHQASLQLPTATQQGGGIQPNRPPSPSASSGNSTFVYKLFQILAEEDEQLIKWGQNGTTFIARDSQDLREKVFSKYFKHKSFESFVRQLNMYGFHKVNKQSRGQRGAENQIYEFKHPNFQRHRADLLDEIRRKPNDHADSRRDANANHGNSAATDPYVSQMIRQLQQQVDNVQQQLTHVQQELKSTRRREHAQEQIIKSITNYLRQQHGAQLQLPAELDFDTECPPPIVISSHDVDASAPHMNLDPTPSSRRAARLTVQTDNLSHIAQGSPLSSPSSSVHQSPVSPMNEYHTAINTPLPPSPSPGPFTDDEGASVGSYQSPNASPMGDPFAMFTSQQQQQQQQQQQFMYSWQDQQQQNIQMMDPQMMAMMQQQQQQQLHHFTGTNM
ncbi:heat shock transcription factor [Lichtheimia corymbifera JMRC:FSU:9682]|uniref:Heat shock transcription factor n=1 Tax=Lichtheimia corymbifera JMRC:FSU:9682 TaxID=1263082 RepID=A0A068RT84_9FUNG|nr:heat shock transcription factor [Lichtheimia corymbifera JMRC:FSU:9682]